MPILTVEIVVTENESLAPNLASAIADAAGEIFGSAPGRTWVRLHALPAGSYAENAVDPRATPHPVFVTVLKAAPPAGDELTHEVARLTAAIATLCSRPADGVHIFYEAAAAGRVAFGGTPVT